MWKNEEQRMIVYRKVEALERIADNLEKAVKLLTELKNNPKWYICHWKTNKTPKADVYKEKNGEYKLYSTYQ